MGGAVATLKQSVPTGLRVSPVTGLPILAYDIHHIVPREYGGTNAFENLVPVLRSAHQQFNAWWRGY